MSVGASQGKMDHREHPQPVGEQVQASLLPSK